MSGMDAPGDRPSAAPAPKASGPRRRQSGGPRPDRGLLLVVAAVAAAVGLAGVATLSGDGSGLPGLPGLVPGQESLAAIASLAASQGIPRPSDVLLIPSPVPVQAATVLQRSTLPPTAANPLQPFRVPVLVFHRVLEHPDAASPDYELSTTQFRDELTLLRAAGWSTITARELGWLLSAGAPPPRRTFVITVDDGTDDGRSQVLPIVRAAGCVATFFAISSRVGTSGYMSWDDLRTLQDAGMEIGDHSTTHPSLAGLSFDAAIDEIMTASVVIQSQLAIRPVTFSYPYGAFDATSVRAASVAGMVAAFTTAEGRFATWDARLTIPRINIGAQWAPDKLLALLEGYVK